MNRGMNIVAFFQELVDKWNAEQKCGFCWSFSAPLSNSGMNMSLAKDGECCCVHLFLTYIGTDYGYKTANTGVKNLEWNDTFFTLYVVKQTNLGVNVYNEIPNHPIDESLWESILEPLENCLGCGNELELCEMGYPFEIMKWRKETVILEHDDNYTGWKINGTFRTYKQ